MNKKKTVRTFREVGVRFIDDWRRRRMQKGLKRRGYSAIAADFTNGDPMGPYT
jgi:hypothetical protein